MSPTRYLALATAAATLTSCFNKKDENYDTTGGDTAAYDTSNPYGVPGDGAAESVPYQPVNPPAENPTYSQAAYEENSATPAPAPSGGASGGHSSAPAASATHTVAKGDTLGGIARKYGVSSAAIKQANGMTSDTVVLGKQLTIPGASGPIARSAPSAGGGGGKTHQVVAGDSLGKISKKYGVSVDAIKKANGLKSDTVVLGSKLRIP